MMVKKEELTTSFNNFMQKLDEFKEDELPLKCPVCGGDYVVETTGIGDYCVRCEQDQCLKVPGYYNQVEDAISHWDIFIRQMTIDMDFMEHYCIDHYFEIKLEKKKLRGYWTTFCEHYNLTPANLLARNIRNIYLQRLWSAVGGCFGWSCFNDFQTYLDKWM